MQKEIAIAFSISGTTREVCLHGLGTRSSSSWRESPDDQPTRPRHLVLVRVFPFKGPPSAWGTFGVTPFLLILLPCVRSQDLKRRPTVSWATLSGILPPSYFPQASIPDPGKFQKPKSFEHVLTAFFLWPLTFRMERIWSLGATQTYAVFITGKAS